MNLPALPILLALLSLLALPVVADDKLPRVAETFEIEGHKAFVYAAPEPAQGMAPLREKCPSYQSRKAGCHGTHGAREVRNREDVNLGDRRLK